MNVTVIGKIKRRFLINFRVDPEVVRKILPQPFSPKIHNGYAIAGICLIRLEEIRPKFLPAALGIASENAAHRVAVTWENEGKMRTGVFIPRRDSNSVFNVCVGGKVFPGVHHMASFDVKEENGRYRFAMASKDQEVKVAFSGAIAEKFPASSCFANVEESSVFFKEDHLGYSVRKTAGSYDGLTLKVINWKVSPLVIEDVKSSYFMNETIFPKGSVTFDHALIMQNIESEWLSAGRLDAKEQI